MSYKQKFWEDINYEHGNNFLNLIRQMPEERISWDEVSSQKYIQLRHIEENQDLNWDYNSILSNFNLDAEFYFQNEDKKWDYHYLWHVEDSLSIFRKKPDEDWDFNELIMKVIEQEPNDLKTLREYSHKPWGYNYFCECFDDNCNSSDVEISEDTILKNSDLPWWWDELESQRSISNTTLMSNPDKTSNAHFLEGYTNIKKLRENLDRDWNWKNLSLRFDIKLIEQNLDLPWDFVNMSYRTDLNIDVIIKNKHLNWSWFFLCYYNTIITLDIVMENLDLDWDISEITSCFLKDMSVLEKYPDFPWKLNLIVKRPEFGAKLIKKYPNYDWNWKIITEADFFGIDFVLENPDFDYDWPSVCWSPGIFMKDIINNPQLNWDWNAVSCNPNLDYQFVIDNQNFPWDWDFVSRTCGIEILDKGSLYCKMKLVEVEYLYDEGVNLDLFLSNPNDSKWNYRYICSHPLEYDREKLIEIRAREYMAAYKIKMFWKKIYYSPQTEIGKRRLERDYQKMFETRN